MEGKVRHLEAELSKTRSQLGKIQELLSGDGTRYPSTVW